MKSYVGYLVGLYKAMFVDIVEYDPSLRVDCERDASRLLSLIDKRGLPFLMVDLPDAAKHFDKCLAAGLLTPSGLAGFRPYSRRGPIPRLFKGLFSRVFDDNGALRLDRDIVVISYIRQLLLAAKKVKVTCDEAKTWQHVSEFFSTDRDVRLPSLNWDENELRIDDIRNLHIGDSDFLSPAPLFDSHHFDEARIDESLLHTADGLADAVQRTADVVTSCLGRFDPFEWRTKHGPGAVADLKGYQFKYLFPNWSSKLDQVFPLSDFGFSNFANWAAWASSKSYDRFVDHEPPSRLIAVPKTLKGPRLIASEPTSYQWCQQSILRFLTGRLADTPIYRSIHFRDQTHNQELARRASHTESHVTIDLSSASDRVSCWLVERVFRMSPSLVQAMHASRTRWVVNTIDKKSPKFHKLRKFACMGSACTFPVQSYIFAILAISSLLYSRSEKITLKTIRKASREVLVFGDDMIVPVDGWNVLQGVLGDLGLKVNPSKTFVSGRFRESCGLDAYDGTDVTPTYTITYPDVSRPESIASTVDTHNNFVKKKMWASADYARTTVAKLRRFRLPFVPVGSGVFGWYDHSWRGNHHLKKRWNPSLQRSEYSVDMPISKSTRDPTEDDATLLQFFTEVQPVDYIVGDRLGVVGRASTSIRRRWVPVSVVETAEGCV